MIRLFTITVNAYYQSRFRLPLIALSVVIDLLDW